MSLKISTKEINTTPPPTPEDMALIDRLWDAGKWAVGAIAILVGWAWKASKDYSRIDVIQAGSAELKVKVVATELSLETFKKEANEKFITRPEHAQMQERCWPARSSSPGVRLLVRPAINYIAQPPWDSTRKRRAPWSTPAPICRPRSRSI